MNPTTPRAMDASEIARLRELCSKATPGAWMRIMCGCHEMGYDLDGVPVGTRGSFGRAEDADFVAAARSALPAALDALESANAKVERLTHEGCPSWMGYEKGCAEADAVEAGRVELERLRAEVERLRADLQEERTEKWKLCADQATEIKRLRAAAKGEGR